MTFYCTKKVGSCSFAAFGCKLYEPPCRLTNITVISNISGADKELCSASVGLAAGKRETATPGGEAGIPPLLLEIYTSFLLLQEGAGWRKKYKRACFLQCF